MFELFATPFLKAVEMLFGAGRGFGKLRTEERERAAVYIPDISECLSRMAQEFAQGALPSLECSQLNFYAENMPDPILKVLGPQTAREVSILIGAGVSARWSARKARLALYTQKDEQIAVLEEAAGRLRGLATTIRVSKFSN